MGGTIMALSPELLKGTVEPLLLRLLQEQPRYGYELIKVVNERSNRALEWKEGTIYPWLHRLEGEGLITSEWVGPADGRQRKYYRITAKGERRLAQAAGEWATFSAAVNVLLFGPTPA
jgi:DNA-binding PadR family transcriptional regulator